MQCCNDDINMVKNDVKKLTETMKELQENVKKLEDKVTGIVSTSLFSKLLEIKHVRIEVVGLNEQNGHFTELSVKNQVSMKKMGILLCNYSCGLSTTTNRVLMSVCVSVRFSVCVSVYDKSKFNGSIHLKLEGIVVFENSSDEFDIGHCPITVKVTA